MATKRIALGYSPALIDAAADYLINSVERSMIADFSGIWVLVPTDEAARRFRAAVAYRFVGSGVVGLELGGFASLLKSEKPTASEAQVLRAWGEVLKSISPAEVAALLPDLLQHQKDRNWHWGIAEMLQECRRALASEGRSLEEVYSELDELCKRSDEQQAFCRFGEFYRLETSYLKCLSGVFDPVVLSLESMSNPLERPELKRIILLGSPDPIPAALNALGVYAERGVDIEVLIGAMEDELDNFDEWGRPRLEIFGERDIKIDLHKSVRCYAGAFEQATKIATRLRDEDYSPFAIGVLDGGVASALEARLGLEESPYQCRIPRPEKLSTTRTGQLFETLTRLRSREISFGLVAALLRAVNVFRALMADVDMTEALTQLDRLQNYHLPLTLGDARRFFGAKMPILDLLESWHEKMMNSPAPLRECLGLLELIDAQSPLGDEDFYRAELELETLKKIIGEALEAVADSDEALDLAVQMMTSTDVDGAPPLAEEAIDLAGFFELPFFTEKNLLIAGFNEENFNYRQASDNFLPQRARVKLKMRTAMEQYAADVWRFDYLTRFTSESGGTVQIMYGRCSAEGKELTPARLLMQCKDAELPERTAMLFGSALEEIVPLIARGEEPKLALPEIKSVSTHFSITSFKAYLDSPFLFYCDRVLNATYIDDRKLELDPQQYGTLIHSVLERFGKFYHGSEDPIEIEEFVLRNFRAILKSEFNVEGNGMLQIQAELMESRLIAFAHEQSRLMTEGWEIVGIEESIKIGFDELLYGHVRDDGDWRNGIQIRGKIDRIDVNRHTGCVRILDYKTSAKGQLPFKASIKTNSRGKKAFALEDLDRWVDLQLPLYLWCIRRNASSQKVTQNTPIECGYFNLPLDGDNAGVKIFENMNDSLLKSALQCADTVLEDIYVNKRFWPINRSLGHSDALFELLGALPERMFELPQTGEKGKL